MSSTPATGGVTSGGYVATGGATIASGGSPVTGTGGALPTGGASSLSSSTVTSRSPTYQCSATAPKDLDPCECDELPCDCAYYYAWMTFGDNCAQGGRMVCNGASMEEYACLGGIWRVVRGGGGSGCSCRDPSIYLETGGAPATGGTSSTSTGMMLGGASSAGGTSGNTAPVITSSGGSYSCPTTDPYGSQQAPCDCANPPCECDYVYTWTEASSCGDSATCDQSLSFDYTCQDGAWQRYMLVWGTGCDCVFGDAGME